MRSSPATCNTAHDWSYLVRADQIAPQGDFFVLSPTFSDCKSVSMRLGVEKIVDLKAKLQLISHNSGHVVEVRGQFSAIVTQICVRTMNPITNNISDEFTAWFADYEQAVLFTKAHINAQRARENLDTALKGHQITEECDDPEPMMNSQIDLADLVQQFLSLAINPYASMTNYEFNELDLLGHSATITNLNDLSQKQDQRHTNPFKLLKNWRPND